MAKKKLITEATVLAALHAVDYEAVGLAGFGRPGNYVQRQFHRWTKQYLASQTEEIESFDKLMAWIPERMPEAEETTIVHGDYGLHNMIFAPAEPRVVGLVDWELSTLGNPLADVSYFASRFFSEDPRRLVPLVPGENGLPTVDELLAEYTEFCGREIPDFTFYVVYNLFRSAAIVQV